MVQLLYEHTVGVSATFPLLFQIPIEGMNILALFFVGKKLNG